jgi:hypothetical protein
MQPFQGWGIFLFPLHIEPNPPLSQRDKIIQPKVARNELPWVNVHHESSTLKELNHGEFKLTGDDLMQPFQGWANFCFL